jgi:hypothetical protein
MPIVMTSNRNAPNNSRYETPTKSLDCGEEFSFDHWARLCELLNESENAVAPADTAPFAEAVDGFKKAVSKVEPAAADQHLAGHVV